MNGIDCADAPNDDGYPASVETDDGSILTVYCQQDPSDEMPSLMTTRWTAPPKANSSLETGAAIDIV